MSESQEHGFLFEDKVIRGFTGLDSEGYKKLIKKKTGKTASYTSVDDIEPGAYPKGHKVSKGVSVKTCGGKKNGTGGIMMGDMKRHYEAIKNKKSKTLIIGRYTQDTLKTKKFYEVWEIDFDYKKLEKCITIPKKEMFEYIDWVKSILPTFIKKGKDKTEKRAIAKQFQRNGTDSWQDRREKLYKKYDEPKLTIETKIDTGQSRTQSSLTFPNIEETFSVIKHSDNYKGMKLPFEIASGKRKRNAKK